MPDQDVQPGVIPLTNTELVQLRIRVIALENAVISLLAQSSDQQLDRVRDVAAYISPRPGFTPHPLTNKTDEQMYTVLEGNVQNLAGICFLPYTS